MDQLPVTNTGSGETRPAAPKLSGMPVAWLALVTCGLVTGALSALVALVLPAFGVSPA